MPSHSPCIEQRIEIDAPAAAVFAVYADVGNWCDWDPDTRKATLDGPLQVGSIGRLHPRKGLPVAMRVIEVIADRSLVVDCPVLGSVMRFEHRLEPIGEQRVRAVHRVSFSGWLAPLLDRSVGRDVRKGLPITMESLKRFVERAPRSAT